MRRRGWLRRYDFGLNELADKTCPILRGWIQYYGRFHRSVLINVSYAQSITRWCTGRNGNTKPFTAAKRERGHG
ncbi:group II intron maturase-specific domain-containing protein [Cupriavidus consociatus]|uniref:group II intron maturase-specific domain-containing protein n=1 Tax=Cupriavidus consociatus TaxID=2821357 RepID=UPI003D75F80E